MAVTFRRASEMSYKRTSADAAEAGKWKRFVAEHTQIMSSVGLPLYLTEAKGRFDHWLMHGTHPQDPSLFCSDDLTPSARTSLLRLVEAYLAAGFKDPGVGILRNEEWDALERAKSSCED